MPQTVIELLSKGSEANYADRFRHGNLICLPGRGVMVATGDIHGQRRNFERARRLADLENNTETHVVLQEIIHGGPESTEGGCLSYKLLFDVIDYKLRFPDRVHVIMGNHDIAFINNSEVIKNGKEMNRAIRSALDEEFQEHSTEVKLAIRHFLFSQPLAVRCENRIWVSHSLPADLMAHRFDPQVLHRDLEYKDLVKRGSAYVLIWGRRHSQGLLDKLAAILDVDIFIVGHQSQPEGWTQGGENLLIIASDHSHGCLLPVDLSKSYTMEQLISSIVPVSSIA